MLTRPAGQSAALGAALRDAGCEVVDFPLIAITPVADSAPLDAALARLGDYALAVFVSPNAVNQAFARLRGAWPEHVPIAVVGPGSIAALAEHGVASPRYRIFAPDGASQQAHTVMAQSLAATGAVQAAPVGVTPAASTASPASVPASSAARAADAGTDAARVVSSDSFFAAPPDAQAHADASAEADEAAASKVSASTDAPVDPDAVRFDSETLIAALARDAGLESFAGKRVLLVRGDGGRELLADTLRARGADVDPVAAYRRSVPSPDPDALTRVRRWLADGGATWVVTSSEAVRNLETLAAIHFDETERAALHRAPWIVPHARIAETARACGFDRVTTGAAGDAALLRAVLASAPQTDAARGGAHRSGSSGSDASGSDANRSDASRPDENQAGAPRPDRPIGAPIHSASGEGDAAAPPVGATPAASSTLRGASSSMTDSKDTPQNTTISPTRFSASGADRPVQPGAGRQRGRLLLVWLALVVAVAAGVAGYALNRKLDRVERALDARQQTAERSANASTQDSARALDATRQTDQHLAQIEGKLADAQGQQQALQNMYQDLARDRTQWTLSEIGEILANASQQLQLTGNVQLALYALQNADGRLAELNSPQILSIRKAIALDIDKLKAAPNADITGLAIKLDDAIARLDALPLAGEGPVPAAAAASSPASVNGKHGGRVAAHGAAASGTSGESSGSGASSASAVDASGASSTQPSGTAFQVAVQRFDAWWADFGTRVLHELTGVVQVRRIDNADAMLIAPDQAVYLRENLRIRLLTARLSLLSRDQKTMDSDLDAADAAIARYFDPNAQATRTVRDLIAQVRHASTVVELPNLDASLDAIHQYKSGD
ncbi:fused uroporphyrinogen-III synthase HemD/membrane protein HemX [Pararobbsia silviterrae]|uniref:fused uroporphyrinogen-III synthase HemD/membrane protein HemX n=1 Tax=Pararobbsia silviterrae TaxID=1792498 RepID=UPI001F0BF743|nr:fused uroporphyrinogen-III synthase HemD/membrane protein HemX [Pararobbsia silviterrae]